ncbi:hypothetical protein BDY24DRAFT_261135 [Mrakia frigida]|uniref:zinc finger MYND domain-containing protein n=1 Tax=Mrakia frigida TaxID=29902 RepID=UPI003FCC2101
MLVEHFATFSVEQLQPPFVELQFVDVVPFVEQAPIRVDGAYLPSVPFVVLLSLLRRALRFGPASKCDFNRSPLHPKLLDETCTKFLATPYLQGCEIDDQDQTNAAARRGRLRPLLKTEILSVLYHFGLRDELPINVITTDREAYSKGSQTPGVVEQFECNVCWATKFEEGGGMKFCSRCACIAYCSVAHQKEDWKKHKLVCFEPSW